ncbi:MAG TPA: oligopeptide:H+ symporter [Victivallales bacterium]|nr:oligopeptide:H+ symporter [Victivallales bacterium]
MEKLRHPKGLYFCFMTEMWERFSFYGIGALLVLYLTKGLHYGAEAEIIFGTYVTYVYITTALGGIIADRLIGYKRCVLLGGTCIVIGNICLALSFIHPVLIFLGLGFVSAGTGLFKSNVTVIVGKLYDSREKLRNSGFAYFYAGINIGALISTFLVGWVGLTYGFNYGFALSAVGMFGGLFIFLAGRKHYPEVVNHFNPIIKTKKILFLNIWHWMIVGIVAIAFIFAYIIAHPVAANYVTAASLVILVVYIASFWKNLSKKEKKNVFMILFLSIFMVLFWSFNNQQSTSFPVYIENFVSHHIFGLTILTTTIMGMYLVILTILNPLIAMLWQKLANKNKEPGDDLKFVFSLVFIGLSFAVLCFSAKALPMSVGLIMFSYMFMAMGELCISPVGLALVTRLAPKHLSSTMMGIWWTISAYAGWIGGYIGAMGFGGKPSNALTINTFDNVYFWVFIASIALAAILLACVPTIRKLTKITEGA